MHAQQPTQTSTLAAQQMHIKKYNTCPATYETQEYVDVPTTQSRHAQIQ